MGWCLLSTLCTWQWEKKGLLGLGMLQSQTAPIAVPSFLSVLTHLFLWGSVFSCSCNWCNWTLCPVWGKVPEFCLRNSVRDTSPYDGLCLGITKGNDVNSCNKMFCGLCHHASERYSTGRLLKAKKRRSAGKIFGIWLLLRLKKLDVWYKLLFIAFWMWWFLINMWEMH